MIYYICGKLAKNLKEFYPEIKLSEARLKHGLIWIVLNPFIVSLILLIGLLSNNIFNTICALSFVLLRLFSGGKHIKNADICFTVSLLLIIILSYYPFGFDLCNYNFLLNIVALMIVIVYSPNRIEVIHNQTKKQFYTFKTISILIVILSFFISNPVMTFSIFVQSLTLLDKKTSIVYIKNRSIEGGE